MVSERLLRANRVNSYIYHDDHSNRRVETKNDSDV